MSHTQLDYLNEIKAISETIDALIMLQTRLMHPGKHKEEPLYKLITDAAGASFAVSVILDRLYADPIRSEQAERTG